MKLEVNLNSKDMRTFYGSKDFHIKNITKHTDFVNNETWFICEDINYLQKAIDKNPAGLIIPEEHEEYEKYEEHEKHKKYKRIQLQQSLKTLFSKNIKKVWPEFCSIKFPLKPDFICLVTGTNGKTSVSWITSKAINNLNISINSNHSKHDSNHLLKSGYIGTLGIIYPNTKTTNLLTTPDALDLHFHLNKMKKEGVNFVIIEASSIGLDQERLAFVKADICVFTNFSQDHLDYHITMDKYLKSKLKIKELFKSDCKFITHASLLDTKTTDIKKVKNCNKIEIKGDIVYGECPEACISYKVDSPTLDQEYLFHYQNRFKRALHKKTQENKKNISEIYSSEVHGFKRENINAAFVIIKNFIDRNASIQNYTDYKIIEEILKSAHVPGRFQKINSNLLDVYVDFAHTPDALEIILKEAKKEYRKVGLVFGCGGDRDISKRSKMGEIAEQFSDWFILTNDNPRSEDPISIAKDVISTLSEKAILIPTNNTNLSGIHNNESGNSKEIKSNQECNQTQNFSQYKIKIVLDRRKAIKEGILRSISEKTPLLIAGKGDERTQETNGVKVHFHDPSIITEILEEIEESKK
ncbi:Mur ligase family protein [Candidatus Nesciobacter abundans]|uniref:Uncharacterized protein n=1 Tax=Candidatus Nesciobacter abundans TaxID=2601668 RepID=A0A5C0UGM3_9PROT|nr:Mur ligase family protein [Candidatus Nesciobacter abundans]QEK38959.1 hypothetical protein FZC36_00710 [Candidatus Nesciobacter abundans]